MRATEEVNRLLGQALAAQAREAAAQKGDAEKRELELRLAAEKARREKAEADAARTRARYEDLLKQAGTAMTASRYDEAIARYEEAGKLYRTDVVLTGLRKAKLERERARVRLEDERKKSEEQAALEARRKKEALEQKAEAAKLVARGRADLDAKRYDAAIATLQEAVRLDPSGKAAADLLEKAKAGKKAVAQKPAPPAPSDYDRAMQRGADLEKRGQYTPAAQAYRDAVRLKPRDDRATKAARFADVMAEGKQALAARRFKEAETKFAEALKLVPDSDDARRSLQQARNRKL
jgi:tetratricopeptide (TPR) repeat protein